MLFVAFNIFFLCFSFLSGWLLCVLLCSFLVYPAWDSALPGLGWLFLLPCQGIFHMSVSFSHFKNLFKCFLRSFLSSPSETPIIWMLMHLMLCLFPRSLNCSAPFILLLIPSSVFFISVIVHVCLFFKSSSFLLNTFCIFLVSTSILFLRSWIIIVLSSFSGRLPIFTSLSYSSGVFSCSFVWNIFLCYLILFNFLYLWTPFCKVQDCTSSCFWCLPLGGWD